MSCKPTDNNLNPNVFPGNLIPGFGFPTSSVQIDLGTFQFPEGFPQDLLDLINSLKTIIPGGTLSPNLDDTTNSVLKALSSIFNQLAPFLAVYNFFQAAFNMILCIIEILCAIPNPWKMMSAVRKLFKRCLPNFLSLFPWLALIAMILALLLLIIALIEYLIAQILKLVEDIIANLDTLSRGLTLQDEDSITATARKIAQLLCLIENLLAIIVAIASILAIINSLAGIRGRSVCGGGNGRGISISFVGDDPGCCDNDVCPPFIADNPDGITGIQGKLVYYSQINTDLENLLGLSSAFAAQFNLPALRPESWQFINEETNQAYSFADIITPIGDGDIFYPEGIIYPNDSKPSRVPYTVDLTLRNFDPGEFNTNDNLGVRDFTIRDCIVYKKPYVGVLNHQNQLDTDNLTGTLGLIGGKVYQILENGEESPYYIDNSQATLENFIHRDARFGNLPSLFDDGYFVENVEFTLNIHHEVLLKHNLITLGCHPDLFQERFVANTRVESVGFDAVAVRLPNVSAAGFLPDALGAHECAINSIQKLRQNVSQQAVQEFKAEIVGCLENFKTEALNAYCNILKAGVSIFETSGTLDTDMQFITRSINVSVQLKDPNGTIISANIPESCAADLSTKLIGLVSLGEITPFEYNGVDSFIAEITSDKAGDGNLTIMYDGNVLKKILNTDSDTEQTVIEDNILNYKFISTSVISTTSGASAEEGIRRDETDISDEG